MKISGKYSSAEVFASVIDDEAKNQIQELCDNEYSKGLKIRVMPDVHAGKGCTIGTTMEIKDKVVPNLVGVDIGCGMLCIKLKEEDIDFQKLDDVIREHVPYGMNVRENPHKFVSNVNIEDLKCKNFISLDRAQKSLGSLGGGELVASVSVNS